MLNLLGTFDVGWWIFFWALLSCHLKLMALYHPAILQHQSNLKQNNNEK